MTSHLTPDVQALTAEVERLRRDHAHTTDTMNRCNAEAFVQRTRAEKAEADRDRLLSAAHAIYQRHGGHHPMGSWLLPGHAAIKAEWGALAGALLLLEDRG